MKNMNNKNMRILIQILTLIIIFSTIIVYNLYTSGHISFKALSIGDMNPYGGWSVIHEYASNSFYEFDGISRSQALTLSILVMSIIGGRFFCGWICPIGAIQDFTSWIGRKVKLPRFSGIYLRGISLGFVKYIVLLTVLLASILGFGSLVAELSFWRGIISAFKLSTAWGELKTTFLLLFVIILVSIFVSRFFCRYLCPLGAIQALFSSLNILKLKYNKNCSNCGKCLENCPVGIKFTTEEDTISPECVRCLNCVEDCKIIESNKKVRISLKNRQVPKKVYIVSMYVLFFIIWLGVPKIWPGQASGEEIILESLKNGIYVGEAKGFAGKITTEVKIVDNNIIEINILGHSESKGWYEEVFMLLPKKIIENQRLNVDVISGATKSSKGLIKSIENAVRKALNKE